MKATLAKETAARSGKHVSTFFRKQSTSSLHSPGTSPFFHVAHKQGAVLQKSPAPADPVQDCMSQKDGNLLPGKVGLVEEINREVGLHEALGKDKSNLENQIRKDYEARRFACEAGVSAILALYYNLDYKKRIDIKLARRSLELYPEYYTLTGYDQTKQTKTMIEKKYNILIERGNKEWSPRDLFLLSEALGKLTEKEIPLIRNYHFIRWTNRCYQLTEKNSDYTCELSDYSTCGLHETDVITRSYTITMYDCMGGKPDEEIKPGYNVPPGAENIIHEIGHAMEFGSKRLAIEKAFDAKKVFERLKKQADAATTTDEKLALAEKLAAAKKTKDDTEKALDKIMAKPALDQFRKLTKGKKASTPYSKRNITEAFAEAYMLFKVAPNDLKKSNKALYDWFSKGGFI